VALQWVYSGSTVGLQ